jgi:hypothetical protein
MEEAIVHQKDINSYQFLFPQIDRAVKIIIGTIVSHAAVMTLVGHGRMDGSLVTEIKENQGACR